jgi:hypothetical protein
VYKWWASQRASCKIGCGRLAAGRGGGGWPVGKFENYEGGGTASGYFLDMTLLNWSGASLEK